MEELIQVPNMRILDSRGREIKKAPKWHRDINTRSLHTISGHWFEIVGLGDTGLVMKYREPTGKKRKAHAPAR